MRLLLDTHTLIWCMENNPTLSEEAKKAIADPHSTIFVSSICIWEIVIKKALGKLEAPDNLEEEISKHDFTYLPITIPHALAIANIGEYHKDTFDRMLIAQAKVEKLVIVTRDTNIKKYNVDFIDA